MSEPPTSLVGLRQSLVRRTSRTGPSNRIRHSQEMVNSGWSGRVVLELHLKEPGM
jgi:hypothetical protein